MACQAITWTNVDFKLVRFCGIHMRAISQWLAKLLFCIMNLKIIFLTLLPHLPGVNELKVCQLSRTFLSPREWQNGEKCSQYHCLWNMYCELCFRIMSHCLTYLAYYAKCTVCLRFYTEKFITSDISQNCLKQFCEYNAIQCAYNTAQYWYSIQQRNISTFNTWGASDSV